MLRAGEFVGLKFNECCVAAGVEALVVLVVVAVCLAVAELHGKNWSLALNR